MLAGAALMVAGCGGDDVAEGPPVITDRALADSLALAAKDRLEDVGLFGTRVGERGAYCQGRDVRWKCTLEIVIRDQVHDNRAYTVAVKPDGCWTARQTGTDVGPTGSPSRPSSPDVLRGCVE
jgi:hypothetical protein